MSWVTKETNGSLIGHGIAFEIVETLRQRYGFTYDVVVPTRETLLNENGSIVYMLVKGVRYKQYNWNITIPSKRKKTNIWP